MELAWLAPLLFLVLLPPMPPPQRARQTAVLLQPAVSEDTEWTRESADRSQREMLRLSIEAARGLAQPPSIIAWPEVPAPLYYDADPQFRAYVNGLARETGAHVLLGVVARAPEGGPLNSAALVSPRGTLVSRYDKVNLVPFGEFVPWPFVSITKKISSEAGDFVPGKRVVVSPVDGHRIGAFICYESVFPNYVRQFAAGGAEVLFNLSNDGYFGHSAAREQHLDLVRMRAAENRRWILRATNDGVTATIDPAGRIRGKLPPYMEAASQTGYTYVTEQTVYTRWGDWFPIACGLLSIGLVGLTLRTRTAPKL
jgi:apolipoprotein N-acyltransferase